MLQLTPIWVFFLFPFLIYMGYLQSKTREVSRVAVSIFPIAMMIFSLYSVWSAFGSSQLGLGLWAVGVAIALGLNKSVFQQPKGVSYNDKASSYIIKGSWIPLWLMMSIFAVKYTVNAILALHTVSPDNPVFIAIASLLFGLLSGTFFARALHVIKSNSRFKVMDAVKF